MSIHERKECKICQKEICFAEWVFHNQMCETCEKTKKDEVNEYNKVVFY